MDINSDSKLTHKGIKNILSGLTARQLYILIYEMYLSNIEITVSDNVEYLTNQIQLLDWDALLLNSYIGRCMNMVIDDEYIDWLKKSLRAAIWFDVYLSNSKSGLSIDRFSLHSDFKHDFLRSFDACHFLGKPDFANTYFNTRSNSFLISNQSSTPFSLKMNPDYEFETASLHTTRGLRRPRRQNELPITPYKPLMMRKPTPPSKPSMMRKPTRSPPRLLKREKFDKNVAHQFRLKINFITSARMKYVLHIASVKDLKWLDDKDGRQIDWAITYLETKSLLWKPYLFIANGYKDKYDQICASIDAFELQQSKLKEDNEILSLSQKDFIEKMRNAWYQIKSKEKNSKEPLYKPPLDKTYQKKLQKLCDNYGVDSSTYLKGLIDDELKKL